MRSRQALRITPVVVTALAIALAAAPQAFAQVAVYGTTAASNSGATFAGGTIVSGSTVRLDDGATVTGNVTNSGTLQFNQSTGNSLTISSTISGTGALTLQNSGTLVLVGGTGSLSNGRIVSLNNTINADAGTLQIGPSGTNTGLQIGASGTGTLNVAGGSLTTISSAAAYPSLAFGVGTNSRGLLNLSSGTISASQVLFIGGTGAIGTEVTTVGNGGDATVTITGGLIQSAGSSIAVASGSASNAAITISNGGQLGSSSGNPLYLGATGTATIDVNSNGLLKANQMFIGYRAGSVGTLNVNASGTVSTSSGIIVCNGTGGAGSTGAVNIASGGYVQTRNLLITGSNKVGTGTVTVSGTLFANGAGSSSESGGFVTVGGTSSGTASLVINSGGYVVSTGTFSRGANGSFTLNSGGTLQIGGITGSNNIPGTIATTGNIGSGTAGALVGDLNFAGTLKFAQNASSSISAILSGSGDVVKTGTGVVTLTGSNSYTGGTTLTAGFLGLGSADAIGSTGTLSFDGGAIRLTASNTTDYSPRFSTAANQQYAVDTNGQTATIATNLANANNSFRKEGLGTLTLTGTNAFTALTTGTNGGVLAGTAASLATSGTATTGASSTIEMTVASGNASWGGQLVGSGTFTKLGAGTLTLTSVATGSTGGRLLISDGAVVGTTDNIRRAVTNNAALTFDQTFSGSTSAVISGSGSLAIVGSGTVILGGNNSYTGGNTVAAGATLEGTALSVRGAIANDGRVTFRSNTNGTYPGTMSGSGVLEKLGTGALTLTGSNTHTGGTVVGAGSIIATTDTIQGNITNNALVVFNQSTNGTYAGNMTGNSSGVLRILGTGTVTLTGTNSHGGGTEVGNATAGSGVGALVGTTDSIQGAVGTTAGSTVTFDQATAGTYAGVMSGSGSLTKSGSGTVTLTGSNTYSGGTTVSAGTLVGTTVSLQGAITNDAAVTFDQAAAGSYAGVMSGSGSLTKSGGGTVTLTQANTFTGATTVSNGTLALGASGGIASSPTITVAAGATLDVAAVTGGWQLGGAQILAGNGTLTGPATAAAGSIVAPGGSIGTLTATGGFTLLGELAIEISGTAIDLFDSSSGALSIGSGTVSFTALAAPVGNLVFAKYLSLSGGAFGTVTGLPTGYSIDYAYLGNQIALVQSTPPGPGGVPEIDPAGLASVLALVAGALGLAERRRTARYDGGVLRRS